jgi:catechol 2,3-dioxygenase-like lactoylglutathione lyase family enzyme
MKLRGLQHVSMPFREGDEDLIRRFYGSVLGLNELEPPASVSALGLVWFAAGSGLELHFFRGSSDGSSRAHFCLDVEDLDDTRRRLSQNGAEPYDDLPIPNRPRFFCRDPSGNLVEFTSIQGDYRT